MVQQSIKTKKTASKKNVVKSNYVFTAADKNRILAALAKSRITTHELQLARCVDSGHLYDQVTM